MYGIFESTDNRIIGFCSDREKADIFVATENLDWDYDFYYVEKLDLLDDEILQCGNRLKKYFSIVFNFPVYPVLDFQCKEVFDFSELEIIDRKDNYSPYFGEDRPTLIKAYSSCIMIYITASNYEEALEEAKKILFDTIVDEKGQITLKVISENITNQ